MAASALSLKARRSEPRFNQASDKKDDELDFLQQQLDATELLPCAACWQETLYAHVEVLERYSEV